MLLWWLPLGLGVDSLRCLFAGPILSVVLTALVKVRPDADPSVDRDDVSRAIVNSTMAPEKFHGNISVDNVESDLIPGTYAYESSHNFDNYLRELGVPYLLRTLASLATPVVTVSRVQHDTWSIRTDTLFKSHSVSFRLGERGTDVTMDGRTIEYVVTMPQGNRLREVQYSGRGTTTTTLTRDFTAEGMAVTLKVNDVVSSSTFAREN